MTAVSLCQSKERIVLMPGFSVFPNAVPLPHLLTLIQQGSLWKGYSFDGAPVRVHQNNQLWERQVPCAPLLVHLCPPCCIHATVRQGSCLSWLTVCTGSMGVTWPSRRMIWNLGCLSSSGQAAGLDLSVCEQLLLVGTVYDSGRCQAKPACLVWMEQSWLPDSTWQ